MTTRESRRPLLEICVDSVAGIDAAIGGGADRIELCSALETGGLTPSAGLTALAVERCIAAHIPVHAMVRPRSGDFAYDATELDHAIAEGVTLADQNVHGLVFGGARHGRIDSDIAERWIAAVRERIGRPLAFTFHRAIDLVDDPVAAVDMVAGLGFTHILTSGGARTAPDATDVIAAMVARAAGRLEVIAGSGVRPDNVAALVDATGVTAVHTSASRPVGPAEARVAAMGFSVAAARCTDADIVARCKMALDNKSNVRH